METAAVICFTEHGAELAKTIKAGLAAHGISCELWIKKKGAEPSDQIQPLRGSLREWTESRFREKDALIFIGAAGIAVRAIAPFVESKKTDPAVVAADERGRYAISLLSGHIGGANDLTRLIAEITGAEPVITTGTDLNEKFAVDEFAARRHLYMDRMDCAREIAARLLDGKPVGMSCEYPVEGPLPPELAHSEDAPECGFQIGIRKANEFTRTLHLVPRTVALGIGCRRGKSMEEMEDAVLAALQSHGIFRESVKKIVSIDLKKEEAGLLALAEKWQLPFETFAAEELSQVQCEDGFTESDFVRSVAGVGNVCERAALLGAGARKLLIPKTAGNGVTVAAAEEAYTVQF